ncbi:hypothetical protein SI65_09427 [Aspergillus cristatus]|uniref:Uncharacterized protein n=1 Tax=Aspergillus cristatus TaxID=573508 RepID=A0A1E3B2R3_ASPCR|nr:hypothetical protein SI65_09427 [Aspergillus cristatus]
MVVYRCQEAPIGRLTREKDVFFLGADFDVPGHPPGHITEAPTLERISLSFIPNTDIVAANDWHCLSFRDAGNGKVRSRPRDLKAIDFTPGGRFVILEISYCSVEIWDHCLQRKIEGFEVSKSSITFSPDDCMVAIRLGSTIKVLELPTCKEVDAVKIPANPTSTIALSAVSELMVYRAGEELYMRDLARHSHTLLETYRSPAPDYGAVMEESAISPDGQLLIVCDQEPPNRGVQLWNLCKKSKQVEFELGRFGPDVSPAFTPDGKFVVTIHAGNIYIINTSIEG